MHEDEALFKLPGVSRVFPGTFVSPPSPLLSRTMSGIALPRQRERERERVPPPAHPRLHPPPCTRRRRQQSNPPSFPISYAPTFSLREVFPVSFGFHIPKGAPGSADTAKQPSIHPTSAPHPLPRLPTPSPAASLLVHMQRKEASPLWQQQNTALQKRCAPLTVTIKKGVDRIRAGDDDLRGRDVQKEARREEKRFSFPLSLFFHTFLFIYLFIYLISFFFFSLPLDSSSPT